MIGRQKEIAAIRECHEADRSKLIVVYGRRRVGKTFLVREAFDYSFTFTHTGIEKAGMKEQLFAFSESLREQWKEACPVPKNWMEAFALLKRAIRESSDSRRTIFLDELPWMDSPRSGFINAVEEFWNGWASARKDIVLIVCGSAAAWMTKKVLQNKGGLFNRASRTLYIEPFTLRECEEYLRSVGMDTDRKEIVSAYMVFGGSAYYWSLLNRGESMDQNVDRLFFAPGAELKNEFRRLYQSVFETPEPYVEIVTALATKKIGMTREELLSHIPGLANNGALTSILENLEVSGFIRRYAMTGTKKKGSVYQLIDNFTLFYLRFVSGAVGVDRAHWSHLIGSRERTAWEGLAFERVCLLHSDYIKSALGIAGVATTESEWRSLAIGPNQPGAQIDLVIARSDRVTNLCEMKFCDEPFEVSAEYARHLRDRTALFKSATKTRASCHVTFVTTYGVKRGKNSSIVNSEVKMDDLFKEI